MRSSILFKRSILVLMMGFSLSAAACSTSNPTASTESSSQTVSDSTSAEAEDQEDASTADEPLACAEDSLACEAPVKADESRFTEISFDDAIAFFQEGNSGVLYFGFPDCPWCQEVVPLLEKEAQSAGVEVFYIRTRDENKDRLYTDAQKEEILPYIESYMSENDEGVMTLYVPLVVGVVDGEVQAGHVGTVDEHDAHERTMTEEEQAVVDQEMKAVIATQLP